MSLRNIEVSIATAYSHIKFVLLLKICPKQVINSRHKRHLIYIYGASIKDVRTMGGFSQPKADRCERVDKGRTRGSETNANVRKICDF